jgi:hypothetical protein
MLRKSDIPFFLTQETRVVMLVLLLFIFGCQQKTEEREDVAEETAQVAAYKKEVLAIHDEVMPLMTDIYKMKKQIREKVADSISIGSDKLVELKGIYADLDSADLGMRVWMRKFSQVKTTGVSEQEALSNLKIEMETITTVKKKMLESVAAAKQIEQAASTGK